MFTALISVALVMLIKEIFVGKVWGKRTEKIIHEMSAATLGIYVMHVGLIEILEPRGIHSQMMPLILGIPCLAVICFVVCFLISAVVRRIPVIGKYIC